MLGYAIFILVLAVFAHNGLLLFWFNQDMAIYGRLRGLNKWILDLPAFLFWALTLGAAFLAAFVCYITNVVGIFLAIAGTVVVLKDIAVIDKVRRSVKSRSAK